MHVFCPDCNAEYKVNERSSLTKTVQFVCIECGSSWVDKFERLEKTKGTVSESEETVLDDVDEPDPDASAESFGLVAHAATKKTKNADNKILLIIKIRSLNTNLPYLLN